MHKFAYRDNARIAVLRPTNAKLALKIARKAKTQAQLDSVFEKCGPYIFVGFLREQPPGSKTVAVLDGVSGEVVDTMQPGDSLLHEDDLAKFKVLKKAEA